MEAAFNAEGPTDTVELIVDFLRNFAKVPKIRNSAHFVVQWPADGSTLQTKLVAKAKSETILYVTDK
jgi:hypothetical protein